MMNEQTEREKEIREFVHKIDYGHHVISHNVITEDINHLLSIIDDLRSQLAEKEREIAEAKAGLCATCKGSPDTCGILSVTSAVTECAGYEEKEGE